MVQIVCENLSIGYGSKVILSNLNFSIKEGDYFCIVGENGSGKTTLMNTMLNLQSPISGNIFMQEGLKFSDIGYLPQQTLVQRDFPASVKEIVLSGCLNRCGIRSFYNKEEKNIAKQAIEKMEISHLSDRCYRELSGGQQQRVLLARALCATRKILLLDEPVSGLDPEVTLNMYQTIYELNKNDGITIIMISHDIDAAIQYASHIMHIDKNIFVGTKEEYLKTAMGQKIINLAGGDFNDWNN